MLYHCVGIPHKQCISLSTLEITPRPPPLTHKTQRFKCHQSLTENVPESPYYPRVPATPHFHTTFIDLIIQFSNSQSTSQSNLEGVPGKRQQRQAQGTLTAAQTHTGRRATLGEVICTLTSLPALHGSVFWGKPGSVITQKDTECWFRQSTIPAHTNLPRKPP